MKKRNPNASLCWTPHANPSHPPDSSEGTRKMQNNRVSTTWEPAAPSCSANWITSPSLQNIIIHLKKSRKRNTSTPFCHESKTFSISPESLSTKWGVSCVSCMSRWVLYHCTTWEAPIQMLPLSNYEVCDFSSKAIGCQVCTFADAIKNFDRKPASSQNTSIWVALKNSGYWQFGGPFG